MLCHQNAPKLCIILVFIPKKTNFTKMDGKERGGKLAINFKCPFLTVVTFNIVISLKKILISIKEERYK